MGFSRLDRKVALLKIGWNQRQIARAVGVHWSLVSHVLAGRRWMGTDAHRIMEFIAAKAGVPVGTFFPGVTRRKGEAGTSRDTELPRMVAKAS